MRNHTDSDAKGHTQTVEGTDEFIAGIPPGEKIRQDGEMVTSVPVGGIEMTIEERKLHRRVNLKMDLCVLPVMSSLYLMSGLDRSNLGNAGTVNFVQDVGMPATAINNASSLFFITFVIFQPLSAAMGKQFGVKLWIPFLMVGWGCFTLANAYVHSEGELIAYRLMIGLFEAGFYPSAAYYLSACYIRFDLALRIAIFYGTYAIAGAFSGVLAYGILQIRGSLHNWQYLFIIEGGMTLVLAVVAVIWLPWHISSAWFLTQQERDWAKERMERDSGGEDNTRTGFTKRDVIEALQDWKFWLLLPCNITSSVPGQAFSVFLPIIVRDLGYTSYRANLFSVPIYVIGAVGLWTVAWNSDRTKERSWHILFALSFVLLGLILVSQISDPKGRYVALCILQIGNYTASPLTIAWIAGNTPSPGKRALVIGLNGWGNLAGVIGSQLFRPQYSPEYKTPFYACLGIIVFAMIGYAANRYLLIYVNKQRAAKVARMTPEELQLELTDEVRTGDKKYTFVYTT